MLSEKLGTPYYIAPEVFMRHYSKPCDVWSTGVLAYILLCGSPPFGGKDEAEIMRNARNGKISFAGDGWKGVSESAKDFVKDLLIYSAE